MPEKRLDRGTLRVSWPDSHSMARTVPSKERSLDPGDTHAMLLDALRDNDFEPMSELRLAPRRTRGIDQASPGVVALDLQVGADEDAVLLVEQDGCYSWHLPAAPAPATSSRAARSAALGASTTRRAPRRTRGLPGEKRDVHFEVDLAVTRAAYPTRRSRALPTGTRPRGMFGDLLSGALRVVVLKFAAPWLVGHAVSFLERHVQPGLVHIAAPDPGTWTHLDRLEELGLRPDARVLLLVHGTFSTTASAFGALGVTSEGKALLADLLGRYDAVVGFDHPTLSVDPLVNATDLLARVSSVTTGVTFDVVTHSRGGLTTRSFAESVLPGSGWNGGVGTVVFVAATNGGTHLAQAQRWNDLVDLTTNLTMVGAGVLAALPGGVLVSGLIAGVVRGLGAFVKYLGAYMVDEVGVPGLAAMRPDGPFVTELNRTQPGQPGPGTAWYVVTSDFHVTLNDLVQSPHEFPKELLGRLAEGLADRIFREANDLVVDTSSMSAIDEAVGGFVCGRKDFGSNDTVYHTNYFLQDEFVQTLRSWLLDWSDRGAEAGAEPAPEFAEEAAPPPAPAPAPVPTHVPTPAPTRSEPTKSRSRESATRGRRAPRREPAAERPTNGQRAEPPEPAPADPVTAHLRGELPAEPLVGAPSTLRVILSRKEIEAAVGSAGDATTFLATPGRTLSVQVVPKANVTIAGPDRDEFALPAGGGTNQVTFEIVPTAAGPITVGVIVRDGAVPLGMLTVRATAVAAAPRRRRTPAPAVATGTLEAGGDTPELDDLVQLEVLESRRGEDTVLIYTVRAARRGLLERYESPPLHDREGYVSELYRDLARLWADHGAGAAYLQGLQDRGAQLFDELFPEPMQRLLWAERDNLAPLVLLTDEAYLPWELVHLKQVGKPRPKEPMFLGQRGLVRWQYTGFPRRTLRARAGKVWALCPSYADPQFVLAETAREATFLDDRFGAQAPKGTGREVTALLRKGGFDLLHFSGHGMADPTDAEAAKVLLAGRLVRGKVSHDYLSATAVAQNARLRATDGSGPLVVLNACQVARGGQGLSTMGGFSRAFLETGAAAYIGCLWSVGEAPARDFVETLYTRLLAGDTIAVAAAAAREAARDAGDATWLAYAVYARPDAVLVTT